MVKYNFPVPRPRGIQPSTCQPVASTVVCTRDMVLHALLGRFAEENGQTWELETIFNPTVNAIDLDVPEDVLQSIETVGVGPNLQRYMHWLHPVAGEDILPGPIEITDLITSEGYEKWEDLRVAASQTNRIGANPPVLTKVGDDGAGSVGVYAWVFANQPAAAEQEIFFQVQMAHRWKIGSNVIPHVHWMPTDANGGTVRWGLECTWSNENETFPDTTIVYGTSDAFDDVALRHFSTPIGPTAGIDGSGKKISSMFNCRLFRNSEVDTYSGGAALLEFDLHYLVDSLGSEAEHIKG